MSTQAWHGQRAAEQACEQDRLVVMVRDPYWLHAYWELAPRSVERAQSALGQHWHTTRPVLRCFHDRPAMARPCCSAKSSIHGGVNHWYVDVQNPPQQFRMEIGYLTASGQFYCLARSNAVTTPPAGTSDSVDENWVDIDENADRIFAMSGGYTQQGTSLELQELLEERLRRPMGTPMRTRYGGGASRVLADTQDLPFAVDAELLVYGVCHPHAHVTLQGEPVPLRPDGSFTVRMSSARPPAGDSRHRQLARRRRAAHDHSGCRAEYQGAGAGDSRPGCVVGYDRRGPRS